VLKEIYNFVADDFFIWNHLRVKLLFNFFLQFEYAKKFSMTLDSETAWTKVVVLEGVHNFVVDYSFYLKSFSAQKFLFKFLDFEILFLNF
jgi:hypothetical protein